MTTPPGSEWESVATRFGADLEQVRRDHLISHVLAAIGAGVSTDDLVFFGGTALSRTHLPQGRLSEDIDLIALGDHRKVARDIERSVARGIARTHGRPGWQPELTAIRGNEAAVLTVLDGANIQVQLLGGTGYNWPTEVREIEQRYPDAPPARLRVLTAEGFAAAKMSAFLERRTPRDLWDLWAMTEAGLIGSAAIAVFARFGPLNVPPPASLLRSGPDEVRWRRDLAHQTRLDVSAADALAVVRTAWTV